MVLTSVQIVIVSKTLKKKLTMTSNLTTMENYEFRKNILEIGRGKKVLQFERNCLMCNLEKLTRKAVSRCIRCHVYILMSKLLKALEFYHIYGKVTFYTMFKTVCRQKCVLINAHMPYKPILSNGRTFECV